jgi:hypothetical protein
MELATEAVLVLGGVWLPADAGPVLSHGKRTTPCFDLFAPMVCALRCRGM